MPESLRSQKIMRRATIPNPIRAGIEKLGRSGFAIHPFWEQLAYHSPKLAASAETPTDRVNNAAHAGRGA